MANTDNSKNTETENKTASDKVDIESIYDDIAVTVPTSILTDDEKKAYPHLGNLLVQLKFTVGVYNTFSHIATKIAKHADNTDQLLEALNEHPQLVHNDTFVNKFPLNGGKPDTQDYVRATRMTEVFDSFHTLVEASQSEIQNEVKKAKIVRVRDIREKDRALNRTMDQDDADARLSRDLKRKREEAKFEDEVTLKKRREEINQIDLKTMAFEVEKSKFKLYEKKLDAVSEFVSDTQTIAGKDLNSLSCMYRSVTSNIFD